MFVTSEGFGNRFLNIVTEKRDCRFIDTFSEFQSETILAKVFNATNVFINI